MALGSLMRGEPGRWRQPRTGSAHRAGAEGMVTAEAALVLPLVALFALALVWMISVGIAEVRVVDAARDGARSIARGDDADAAARVARRTAGADASVRIRTEAGLVSVEVSQRMAAPHWLLVPLPPVTVSAISRVESEDDARAR